MNDDLLTVVGEVMDEVLSARRKHANMNSLHEAYSVILEEVDEFWDEVKKKAKFRDKEAIRKELVQVAAMCVRAITDLELSK